MVRQYIPTPTDILLVTLDSNLAEAARTWIERNDPDHPEPINYGLINFTPTRTGHFYRECERCPKPSDPSVIECERGLFAALTMSHRRSYAHLSAFHRVKPSELRRAVQTLKSIYRKAQP